MTNTTDPPTIANNTEPSSTMETKTLPLAANVARILLLLRSLQRGRHNLDDPWIVLPLQLHEYDDLLVRIEKNETIWGWVCDKLIFSYDSRTSTFVLRRPVTVHQAFKSRVGSWIKDRLDAIADSNAQSKLFVQDIAACGSANLLLKPLSDERVVIHHNPDSQFMYIGTCWPTVIIEIANSPGLKSLSRLAEDYILQSQGNIRAVVGFEFDMETKRVSLTVWRPEFFMGPEKEGLTVGLRSETQILRDEQGTINPAEGSGLRLTLRDFAPDFDLDLLSATAVHDASSILIHSAVLYESLSIMEESERKRAAGELITSSRYMNCVKKRHERTPEPVEVYEDGFVFGEEELSVHARFLDQRVCTGKVGEGSEMVD
ncbi:hypothetical protein VE02_06112 [Pseudogymnoascus sp. 03VT05]|nr:hypothetical protein VE02_06112 [Pseudogymnoascus sp. 03VT05]